MAGRDCVGGAPRSAVSVRLGLLVHGEDRLAPPRGRLPWDSDTFATEGATGDAPQVAASQVYLASARVAGERVEHDPNRRNGDDVVGARCHVHAAHLSQCRVVKRCVGPIAVLDRLFDREAIDIASARLGVGPGKRGEGNGEQTRKEPR